MSGPDCVWCGMTIDAHREQGLAAKTPCGMLKRGFKPITQTSVGDVPAPYIENDDVALHKRLCQADDGANADLPAAPTLEQRLQKIIAETVIDGVAIGTKHERAAVVKYLRTIAESTTFTTRAQSALRLAAEEIEGGMHQP